MENWCQFVLVNKRRERTTTGERKKSAQKGTPLTKVSQQKKRMIPQDNLRRENDCGQHSRAEEGQIRDG